MASSNDDRIARERRFPWLTLIARMRFRSTLDPRKVALAAVGLLVIQMGWSGLDWLFGTPARAWTVLDPGEQGPNRALGWDFASINHMFLAPLGLGPALAWGSFSGGMGWRGVVRGVLAIPWFYGIGGLVGGAICRMIMVEIGRGGRVGLREAMGLSWRSRASVGLAPLGLVLLLMVCAGLLALYGLIYRIPVIGPAIGGLGLVVPLALGFLMTLIGIVLFLGWPLMLAAVASGADDALDVTSRVISYLQQKLATMVIPLAYAYVMGILGLALIRLIETSTIRIVLWSLSFGGPGHGMSLFSGDPTAGDVSALAHMGWLAAVRLVVSGWVWCYYATTACYLYLWLRQEVDGAPWDELDRPAPPRESPTAAGDGS